MSNASDELGRIDRIHDAEPEAAASALLQLDPAPLGERERRSYAFLLNHVLGEKLGRWREAADRLSALAAPPEAASALLRQHAVALRCAGDAAAAEAAQQRLAQALGVAPAAARLAVEAGRLNFTAAQEPEALAATAERAAALPPGPLDESLAAAFNNATTALYYATLKQPLSATVRTALLRGADAALLFWLRAGGWMQHERAHYLCAKVALRAGESAAAIAAAERGLSIVAANGDDATEKCFLLQLLAAGVERAGQAARAQELRSNVAALSAGLDGELRELLAQDAAELGNPVTRLRIAFVGGGNMASALLGGLVRAGAQPALLHVIEPDAERRAALERDLGVTGAGSPTGTVKLADLVVLAVKPQQMQDACRQLGPYVGAAVVVSVAAGIRASDIARWLSTERVVRAMPNTPALIGRGVSGMAALPAVSAQQRSAAEQVLGTAGPVVWFDDESQLDAVTAVSGSGPAYVFYFMEALLRAGHELGFSEAQARTLALATFTGASQLAAQSDEPPGVLRERVTSKGGTTAAALAVLDGANVSESIVQAVRAAQQRAVEMAEQFGR